MLGFAIIVGLTGLFSCEALAINGTYGTNFGGGQLAHCVEGQTKKVDCNYCTCMGGSWACTEMACPPSNSNQQWHSAGDHTNPQVLPRNRTNQEECNPGDRKQVDCNSCWCSNGRWACTLMGCPNHQVTRPGHQDGRQCRDGDTKMMDCNHCYCSNGVWACTLMGCPNYQVTRPGHQDDRQCRNGDRKMIDCNRCWCSNGVWACTLMGCPNNNQRLNPSYNRNATQVNLQSCETGETKMHDCNHCWCSNGSWACTMMACRERNETRGYP